MRDLQSALLLLVLRCASARTNFQIRAVCPSAVEFHAQTHNEWGAFCTSTLPNAATKFGAQIGGGWASEVPSTRECHTHNTQHTAHNTQHTTHSTQHNTNTQHNTEQHRHTDTQTHRHTDTQTHRHTDTQTHRHRHSFFFFWNEMNEGTQSSQVTARGTHIKRCVRPMVTLLAPW